jgi:hypothetical protein
MILKRNIIKNFEHSYWSLQRTTYIIKKKGKHVLLYFELCILKQCSLRTINVKIQDFYIYFDLFNLHIRKSLKMRMITFQREEFEMVLVRVRPSGKIWKLTIFFNQMEAIVKLNLLIQNIKFRKIHWFHIFFKFFKFVSVKSYIYWNDFLYFLSQYL